MRKADIAGGAAGVAIGAWVLFEGARMPTDHIMKVGPSYFPNLLAIALVAFSILLVLKGVLAKDGGGFVPIDFRSPGIRRAAIALAAALVYTFLLKRLGFIPDTVLFTLGLMLLLGSRRIPDLVLVPPLVTLGVWLVFDRLLLITLPVGVMSIFGL